MISSNSIVKISGHKKDCRGTWKDKSSIFADDFFHALTQLDDIFLSKIKLKKEL